MEGMEELTLEEVCLPSGLINAVILGYQVALNRTLGKGAAAMTQLLIKDIGEILEDLIEEAGFELGESTDLKNDISKAMKMLGVSDKVVVESPGNGTTSGSKYIIKIEDSVFKPVARILEKKGIPFTLAPEAFIAAALVRKAVRKKNPNAQVRIKVHPQKSADEPLVIEVTVR